VPSLCIGQMRELGACCVALEGPRIERRIGLMRLADHKLSAAAQALEEVLVASASG
jgi:LysR family carnitine catabolism transcriptional activator